MRRWLMFGLVFVCFNVSLPISAVGPENPSLGDRLIVRFSGLPDLSKKSRADLLRMLQDQQPENRCVAIEELSRRKDLGAAPQIKELLGDQSGVVRFKAAAALLDMGDQNMLPVLRDLLKTLPARGKIMVAEVLARNGDDSGLELAKSEFASSSFTRRTAALSALAASKNDEVAYPALEAGLKDSDEYVRDMAINKLGSRPGKRSVELLGTLLSDPDKSIRWLAVAALTRNGSRDVIPLLLNALGDPDLGVSGMASSGLNRLTGQNKRTVVLKPERARDLETEWRDWWEANKDKPLPAKKN